MGNNPKTQQKKINKAVMPPINQQSAQSNPVIEQNNQQANQNESNKISDIKEHLSQQNEPNNNIQKQACENEQITNQSFDKEDTLRVSSYIQQLQDLDGEEAAKKKQKIRQSLVEREDKVCSYQSAKIDTPQSTNLQGKQLEDFIKFRLLSETNDISIKESKNFVCGINLLVTQPEQQKQRAPIDLICVIDDSGSMIGQKARLVRKSLNYLLKITNENDRICLISFSTTEKILTPFLLNNLKNKNELKAAVKSITGTLSTNIESGIEAGLWMIKNRKEKNPVTCLFLLSDGNDDEEDVDLRVNKLVESYQIKDNFAINTYGYGKDHNSRQMRKIAQENKGNYFYIDNLTQVSDWFILSLSGFMGTIAEEVTIKLKVKNTDLTNIRINKVFGEDQLWIKKDFEKGSFEIYLPHLSIGDKKYFVFECEFTSDQFSLNDQNRNILFLESQVEIRVIKQEYIVRKNDSLSILFHDTDINQLSDNSKNDYYLELMSTYYRALGGLKIKEATQLINQDEDYKQAQQILKDFKLVLQSKQFLNNHNGIHHLEEDLDEAIEKCQQDKFDLAKFEKMEIVHLNKQYSICHLEEWDVEQEQVMNNFRNKKIALSEDDSDNQSNYNSNLKQKFHYSDSEDDDDKEVINFGSFEFKTNRNKSIPKNYFEDLQVQPTDPKSKLKLFLNNESSSDMESIQSDYSDDESNHKIKIPQFNPKFKTRNFVEQ